jgi:hypothetical protein
VEQLASIDWAALLPFIAVGFAAQLIDGAMGMAFGLINSTLLVSMLGVSPAVASASVHAVETFTTAASGISHVAHRNVDWRLLPRIAVPGVIGGILGAYALTSVGRVGREAAGDGLSGRGRPVSAATRVAGRGGAQVAPDHRAAGTGWRFPGCRWRRWLGADRHLQPAHPGRGAAQDHRHGEHRRVLHHVHDLRDLSGDFGLGRVYRGDVGPADRRIARRAARRRAGQARAGAPADGGRRRAADATSVYTIWQSLA